jgi:inhibitor of KinA
MRTRLLNMKIVEASDSSLLVILGDAISREANDRVIGLFRALQGANDRRVRNIHPAYASVLIDFDPARANHREISALVRGLAGHPSPKTRHAENVVTIPVCYDFEFGPDLRHVADHAKISIEEAIHLHSSAAYRVHFLGFSPGFAYLGGLAEQLHVPRLETPRKAVPAGAVAIAGSQAAVYPVESPGGWRLIGRTPMKMFDPKASPPALLQPGDTVRFSPIDRAAFEAAATRRAC